MNNRNRKKERGEVFVEVEGFGNRYEISNRGRLWSNISNRYLGHKNKKTGYIHTILHNEEGEQFTAYIHRLVAEAFIPNDDPENKTEINHKNYKRDDNRVENLEWVSHQENMDYSYDNIQEGLKKKWEDQEFREKMKDIHSNTFKKKWEDEEFREKVKETSSNTLKKKWEDQEFREKMKETSSNLMKENNKDPEFQVKRLEGLKKKWEDQEFRERKKEGLKKRNEDPEFQVKRLEGLKKKWEDEDFRKRRVEAVIEAKRRPVEQYNIDGELVGTYPSLTAAQEATGIIYQNINHVLKGRQLTAGGYKWKYKEK